MRLSDNQLRTIPRKIVKCMREIFPRLSFIHDGKIKTRNWLLHSAQNVEIKFFSIFLTKELHACKNEFIKVLQLLNDVYFMI